MNFVHFKNILDLRFWVGQLLLAREVARNRTWLVLMNAFAEEMNANRTC